MKARSLTLALVAVVLSLVPATSHAGVGGANPPPRAAVAVSQTAYIVQLIMSMM